MAEKMTERESRQQAFIRVCRDSGFTIEASRAANIAASAIGVHPLEIWTAIGSLERMDRIASGEHPATRSALASTGGTDAE